MKWFKHKSDMIDDPKIRRVVRKHGAEGYAVYNLILERITKRIEKESPLPDLEETSSDIAEYLRIDTVHVEEIMLTCLHEGLFEQDEMTGRILCTKVYKFLEQSTTRSAEIRALIDEYKAASEIVRDCPRLSETVRDNHEEQKRREQKRREEKHDTGFEDVTLTTIEYEKLTTKYPKEFVDEKILRLATWQAEHEMVKKSAYRTLLNWLKDDYEKWRKEHPQPEPLKTCASCGAAIVPGLSYCRECGENV